MTPPPTSHLYLTSAISGSMPVVSQSIMNAIVPVGAITEIWAFLKPNLVPRPYRCINEILRDILSRNLASVGSMHSDNVEEGLLVARVASEGSQPLGDE